MHRHSRRVVMAAIGLLLALSSTMAVAADRTWPREMNTDKGILTIYQPQPEKFENNVLRAAPRCRCSQKGKTEPVFGVFWFTGRWTPTATPGPRCCATSS